MSERQAETSSWARDTAQGRSRDTARRILETGLRLLSERRLESLSVAQIAQQAGVSVGGFYGRFPSKEALIRAVGEHFIDRHLTSLMAALDPKRLAGAGIARVIRTYVEQLVRTFTEQKVILRQAALRARDQDKTHYSEPIRRLNHTVLARLSELLLERRHEIGHVSPEEAVTFGELVVSAAAREAILYRESALHTTGFENDRLVQELTRCYCAYLGVAEDNTLED